MRFSKLAQYFSQLEKTASRNKMTEILARLFKEADPKEIDKICYLSLGRLAPLYEGVEFNLAEKMMVKVLSQAYQRKDEEIKKKFKKIGDFGDVAASLNKRQSSRSLSVSQAYDRLRAIAEEGGEGSVERKIKQTARLLGELDGQSAKYIVRIPLGKLRLGFSDQTILDSFSWMLVGDKSKKEAIESAYNIRADVGQIAKIIKSKGLKGIKSLKVQLGTPLMMALCQRLANPEEMIAKMCRPEAEHPPIRSRTLDKVGARSQGSGGKVAIEPKYDGQRCLGGYTGIYSRDRGFISIKKIKPGDWVLTHRGRFKPVMATNKRKIDKREKVFKFQTYLGEGFKITAGHRLFLYKEGKGYWAPIEKVRTGDWLVFPRPQVDKSTKAPAFLDFIDSSGYKKKIELTSDFYRFLGFWVGDGYTNASCGNKRIGLCFNFEKEKRLIREYEEIISQVLKIRKISRERRKRALNLYWRDGLFQHWLCHECRVKEHGKTVPQWFRGISLSSFEAFLRGWIEAAGASRHSGSVRLTTKEKDLASLVQLMALSFGKAVGLRKERGVIPGKDYSFTYYSLIFPGTSRYIRRSKQAFLVKVLRRKLVVKPDSRMIVYNLQVQDDESYLTSLAALHNCQIHAALSPAKKLVKIFTRNLENTTAMFPDIAAAVFKEVKAQEAVLDGEAIGYDPRTGKLLPFQETIKRKRKYDIKQTLKDIPLRFYCFDILYKDGQDLLSLPFAKRRKILEKVIKKGSKIILLAPQTVTDNPQDLRAFHQARIKEGLEGAVVKKWQAPYDPGRRGYTWVKFKQEKGKKGGGLADTLDCVVMGYYRGRGKRASFGIGGFLVGVRKTGKIVTVSKIGTGLTDDQWREMRRRCDLVASQGKPRDFEVDKNLYPDIWCEPKILVEIEADNITKSPIHTASYALRFPRLIRFRDDKSAHQATTIKEIKKLYGLQG